MVLHLCFSSLLRKALLHMLICTAFMRLHHKGQRCDITLQEFAAKSRPVIIEVPKPNPEIEICA